MEIDHDKLKAQCTEWNDLLDGKIKANDVSEDVQKCLILMTYSLAQDVLKAKDRKAAFAMVPKEWQQDVKEFSKLILSHSKTERK